MDEVLLLELSCSGCPRAQATEDIQDPLHRDGLLRIKPRAAAGDLPPGLVGLDDIGTEYFKIWDRAEATLLRPIASGYEWALTMLRDLGEAADQLGARPAFEARLAELRARTASATRFWCRWSAEGFRTP